MIPALVSLIFLTLLGVAVLLYWRLAVVGHQRRLSQLAVRVHVNGIPGRKSRSGLPKVTCGLSALPGGTRTAHAEAMVDGEAS